MKIKSPKVVLDTNIILASILRTSPFRHILNALEKGMFTLYLNFEIMLEYEEKLQEIFDISKRQFHVLSKRIA